MREHRHGLSQALQRLARERDAEAWALIVERCQPAVERLARRLAGNVEIAADAVQESWLEIREDAGQFSPRGDDPDAGAWGWIMRVTANATVQMCRRHRSQADREASGAVPTAPTRDALERDETAVAVRAALAELPETTCAAVVLHHIEGLPFAEIAAALGCSPGTAMVRAHRGMKRLRDRLSSRGVALGALALAAALRDLPATEGAIATAAPALLHAATPALGSAPAVGGGLSLAFPLAIVGSVLVATAVAVTLHLAKIPPPDERTARSPTSPQQDAPTSSSSRVRTGSGGAGDGSGLPGRVVFFRDFDVIRAGETTTNPLVTLEAADGRVTAIASKPCTARSSTWNPDVVIEMHAGDADTQALYEVPENMEIRIRLRSEKPGTWYLTQKPAIPTFKPEHFYTAAFEIGSDWREFSLRGKDLRPYRTEGRTRDLIPGMGINDLGIYGYGSGQIFMDWFAVVSLGDDGPGNQGRAPGK